MSALLVKDTDGKLLGKGDLIEFYRGYYSHWGIYDGSGYVIHVTGEPNAGPGFGSVGPTIGTSSALSGNVSAEVKREKWYKVVNGDKFYKNNLHDDRMPPLSANEIIRRASAMIGINWDYDLLRKNCEHFVCKMRYDVDVSQQVIDTITNVGIGISVAAVVSLGVTVVSGMISYFSKGTDDNKELRRR